MSEGLNTKSRVTGDCQARFREGLEVRFLRPTRQYFLGLKGFTQKPVFDPSLLVYIRKRIDLNVFESLTDELIRKGLNIKQAPAKESEDDDDDEPTPAGGAKNKGKLQLDVR